MKLLIATDDARKKEFIFAMAHELGLETSSAGFHDAIVWTNQGKPDFILVDCDAKDGTRTIEKLESLESDAKVFGFGFSKQPAHVQNYVRLPILILELASTFNIKTNKGEKK